MKKQEAIVRLKIPHIHIILYNYLKKTEELFFTLLVVMLRPLVRPLWKKRGNLNKKDRIKIIHYTESPWYGGVVKVILRLIPFLRQKECDQVLVCRSDEENEQRFNAEFHELMGDGLALESIDLPTSIGFLSIVKVLKLTRIFKKHKADILHIHKANWYRDKTAVLAGQLAGIPGILNYELCADTPNKHHKFLNWIKGFRERHIVDRVMIMSKDQEPVLRGFFGLRDKTITYVPNFLDVMEFGHKRESNIFFGKKRDISEDNTFIGVAARLVPEKGVDDLLEAMTYVVPSFPQVRVMITGDGEQKEQLIEKSKQYGIEDNVEFLGFLESEKMPDFFDLLDIGVLPSLNECMPCSILEYMASALPVVATSINGTKDLIIDGVTGFLIPMKDPKALAEAIIKLLKNPKLAVQMGLEGKKRIEQEFTTQIVGEQIHALYKDPVF